MQARPLDPIGGSRVKILVPQMFFRTQIGPKFFSNPFFRLRKNGRNSLFWLTCVGVLRCFLWGGRLKAFFLGIQKQQEAAVITQMYIDTFPYSHWGSITYGLQVAGQATHPSKGLNSWPY